MILGFEKTLRNIQRSLEGRGRDKDDLYTYYLSARLNASLYSYRSDLEQRIKYLNNRRPENVLKGL